MSNALLSEPVGGSEMEMARTPVENDLKTGIPTDNAGKEAEAADVEAGEKKVESTELIERTYALGNTLYKTPESLNIRAYYTRLADGTLLVRNKERIWVKYEDWIAGKDSKEQ